MQISKRITLSNNLANVFSLIMVIWAVLVYIADRDFIIPSWDLSFALAFKFVPYINKKGFSCIGRTLLVILTNGVIFFFPSLFGEHSGTHYCFFPAACLPFVLFETRQKIPLFFGMLLPIFLFCLLINTDFSLVPHVEELPEKTWVYWSTIVSAFFISTVPIYLFSKANENAARELMMSEKKYSQIVEMAQEGIWTVSLEGIILYANEAMAKMLQVGREQLQGSSIEQFISQEQWQHMQNNFAGRRFERMISLKDGLEISTLVSSNPLLTTHGKMLAMTELVYDLSEAKKREKLIQRQQEQMVAAAKLTSLGEMASGIAHEINNPLMVISLMISLMNKKLNRESPPKPATLSTNELIVQLEKIQSLIKRIVDIIEGLRKFSQDETALPMQLVSLEQIFEETLSFCRERFLFHGVELWVQPIPSTLQVYCQKVQISQILLNLLNNAFTAVSDLKEQAQVKIQVETTPQWLIITVADNGPGIPENLREKIFEPFFTTRPIGQGTGLGLSISKGIAKAHKGNLAYRPAPEGGACFILTLPVGLDPGLGPDLPPERGDP